MTTIITQKQTVYVDLIPFDATFWFDESDGTVDIEAYAVVRKPVKGTLFANVHDVEAMVYTVPISEWDSVFETAAREAIANAGKYNY